MTIESAASPMETTMDGAFMEQSGRNRWQSLANDGKEGVDGSSPSEGFKKSLQIGSFCLPVRRRLRVAASTERPPASTGRARSMRRGA